MRAPGPPRGYFWELSDHPDDVEAAFLLAWLLERLSAPRDASGGWTGKSRDGKPISRTEREHMMRVLDALGVEFSDRDGEQRVRCPVPDHRDDRPSCDLDLRRGVWVCRSHPADSIYRGSGGVNDLEALLKTKDGQRIQVPHTEADQLGDDPEERAQASRALGHAKIAHDPDRLDDQVIVCPTCGGDAQLHLGGGVRWWCQMSGCHGPVRGNLAGLEIACGIRQGAPKGPPLSTREIELLTVSPCGAAKPIMFGHRRVASRKTFIGCSCNVCSSCRERRVIEGYLARARRPLAEAPWVGVGVVERGQWNAFREAVRRRFSDPAIARLMISTDEHLAVIAAAEEKPDFEPKKARLDRGLSLLVIDDVRVVALGTCTTRAREEGPQLARHASTLETETPPPKIEIYQLSDDQAERLEHLADAVRDCAIYAGSPDRQKGERVAAWPRAWPAPAKAPGEWCPEADANPNKTPTESRDAVVAACQGRGVRAYSQGSRALIADVAHHLWPEALDEGLGRQNSRRIKEKSKKKRRRSDGKA